MNRRQDYSNKAYLADDTTVEQENDYVAYSDLDEEFVIIESSSGKSYCSGELDMSTGCIVDLRDADSDLEVSSAAGVARKEQPPDGRERGKTRKINHRSKTTSRNTKDDSDKKDGTHDRGAASRNNTENNQVNMDNTYARKNTSSPPKNKPRNVVYYQNRFIVLDADDSRADASPNLSTSRGGRSGVDNPQMRMAQGRVDNFHGEGETETSFTEENVMDRERPRNRKVMEMDASSVTMDARGIEIILTDPENASRNISTEDKKKNTIWKKIHRVLLDNRVKGNPNIDLVESQEDYKILKKVLNITFLTVGVVLFLAVVISVTYAFIVGDTKDSEAESKAQHTNSSTS